MNSIWQVVVASLSRFPQSMQLLRALLPSYDELLESISYELFHYGLSLFRYLRLLDCQE